MPLTLDDIHARVDQGLKAAWLSDVERGLLERAYRLMPIEYAWIPDYLGVSGESIVGPGFTNLTRP